ncbi:MAG: hypothetical protein AB4040_17970 [Synechococcus sp.]
MTSQLTYRGQSFEFTAHKTVDTTELATFRGRETSVSRLASQPVKLPADLQFFGRHTAGEKAAVRNQQAIAVFGPLVSA